MKKSRNELSFERMHVTKTFTVGDIDVEKMIYQQLIEANFPVAKLLEINESSLVIERLSGQTMNELFELYEKSAKDFLPMLLAWEEYLVDWHQVVTPYRYGDVNMNNFIFHKNRWIGIDFEQALIGDITEDFADMMCFILFHRPHLSEYKIELIHRWMHQSLIKYLSREGWQQQLHVALKRLNERRNTTYSLNMTRILGENV